MNEAVRELLEIEAIIIGTIASVTGAYWALSWVAEVVQG